MTSFLSALHTELRQMRFTRRGATHAPEDVPRGVHKTYPRMMQLPLLAPAALPTTLVEALNKRTSYHPGSDTTPLSLQNISTLLGHALGSKPSSTHRHYPSGGGLYPIETYLVSNTLEGQTPAVFHYNPTTHALERLWDVPHNFAIKDLIRNPTDLLFSSVLIFTSVWKRSSAKYGDFTYNLATLETGHMSENILLVATALGMRARPMAAYNDDDIVELLDIDPQEEQPLLAIALC